MVPLAPSLALADGAGGASHLCQFFERLSPQPTYVVGCVNVQSAHPTDRQSAAFAATAQYYCTYYIVPAGRFPTVSACAAAAEATPAATGLVPPALPATVGPTPDAGTCRHPVPGRHGRLAASCLRSMR